MAQRVAVRPEEIRRANLSLLLRHIHQHGEVSRAELTAASGLNRSTIGTLVSDLVALGLVTEYVPSGRDADQPVTGRVLSTRVARERTDRAGRPSHVVAPRPGGPYVVAVDVAVERIVTAAVGLGGVVHERRATVIDGVARRPASVIAQIVDDTQWLAERLGGAPVGIGVAIPGTVRSRDGFVEHAPNLNWRAVPFADLLSNALPGAPEVQVGNDADLGAVAEHQRGVAVGIDHLVYLNGSVGVGSGIIAAGSQVHGSGGYAGEIGHMTMNPDGPPCHCGSTGCIETYIGEHALLRAAGITDQHGRGAVDAVFASATEGDERSVAAVHTVAIWLGRGLANVVNCFNPQAIVVGGTLAEIVRIDRGTVEAELDVRAMTASRAGMQLLLPGLDQDSALIGASELAFQTLLTAPDSPAVSLAN